MPLPEIQQDKVSLFSNIWENKKLRNVDNVPIQLMNGMLLAEIMYPRQSGHFLFILFLFKNLNYPYVDNQETIRRRI